MKRRLISRLQALVLSDEATGKESDVKLISDSTRGVVFFATPHSGLDVPSLRKSLSRLGNKMETTRTPIVNALDQQSEDGQLLRLRDEFSKFMGQKTDGTFRVYNFMETKPVRSLLPSLNNAARVVSP